MLSVSACGAPDPAVQVAPPSPLRKMPCEVATISGRFGIALSISPAVIDETTAPAGHPDCRSSQAPAQLPPRSVDGSDGRPATLQIFPAPRPVTRPVGAKPTWAAETWALSAPHP